MFSNVAFYKTGNKEIRREKFKPFEKKVWLSSPTMHGDEMKFIREAYETNWMSTIGANINAVERLTCEKVGCKYAVALSSGTAALHLAIKLAGERLYGQPAPNQGALEGRKVFCSDMTFDATVNPVAYDGACNYSKCQSSCRKRRYCYLLYKIRKRYVLQRIRNSSFRGTDKE